MFFGSFWIQKGDCMNIVQMWNYGVVSIGEEIRVAILLYDSDNPLLLKWLRKLDDRIEDMWQFGILEVKDMQHFRKVFRMYCLKRFNVCV